jgi:putative restriction endonuclease
LILAFELYCRIPFKKTKASTSEVRELATLLNRSSAAVARKLGNFGAFDPELQKRNISGLTHFSRLDREVWNEFHANWSDLVLEAYRLKTNRTACNSVDYLQKQPIGPSERMRMSKQRIHQTFFRDTVLSNYEGRCCVTGLSITECLIASHIVPWSQDERYRVDPTNGLCLSATFDRLFDAGLISINADLTIHVSARLQSNATEAVVQHIRPYHGRSILRPHRFLPSTQHLKWHQQNIFKKA